MNDIESIKEFLTNNNDIKAHLLLNHFDLYGIMKVEEIGKILLREYIKKAADCIKNLDENNAKMYTGIVENINTNLELLDKAYTIIMN